MNIPLKPTQKPVCFAVQQLLYKYKSDKENQKSENTYRELFETVLSRNSFDTPNQETTQASIHESVNPEQLQNDVILQTNHVQSVFKYLNSTNMMDNKN